MSRRPLLVLCLFAFFTVMTVRLSLSSVVPAITKYFDVSNGDVSLALTGLWATYALLQYPSGLLSDRFGERRIIISSLGLITASTLLVSFAPVFRLFLVFVVLLGASAGLYYSVATSLLTKQFENTGRAIGVHAVGAPLAGLVVPGTATWLAATYNWRIAVLMGVVIAVPVLVGAIVIIPSTDPPRRNGRPDGNSALETISRTFRRPSFAVFTVASALGWFAYQATASFLPAFLVAYHDVSIANAGLGFSGYFAVLGSGMVVGGDLSDRIGRDRLLGTELIAGIAGFSVLVVAGSTLALGVGIALVGVAMAWPVPVEAHLMDVLGDEGRGTAFGLVRSVYMTVGALGSFLVGTAADRLGWEYAIGLLGILLALMLLIVAGNVAFRRPVSSEGAEKISSR